MREGSETISKESRTFVRSGDRHLLMDEDIVRGGIVKGIIYCAYNKINNKRYIGQTIQRLSERKSAHYNKNGCPYFHHALLKYAVTDWDWFILDECNSLEELNEKEKYWINFYDTTNHDKGYNIQSGGQDSKPNDEEVRYARQRFLENNGVIYEPVKRHKNIRCVETNKTYKNAAVASRETNITHSHITEAANGKLKTAGGFHWEWCLDLKLYPNALYCKELDKYYLSLNEAHREDNFSNVMLGRALKEQGSPCKYAGYTFYKINA